MIWSGRGSSPGITSSSPVAMMATTGRRVTVTLGMVHRGQQGKIGGAQAAGGKRVPGAEILRPRADVRAGIGPD
jgi:hypothetical protein